MGTNQLTTLSADLNDLLRCPQCRGKLSGDATAMSCGSCGKTYPVRDGRPCFVEADTHGMEDAGFQNEQMHNSSLSARLFNLGSRVVNSDFTPRDELHRFLCDLPEDAVVTELGSGNRRLRPRIVNVDLFPFPNVDVLADIQYLPFPDDSVDYVVLDTVIEHVPEPKQVVDEIHRVLRTGGKVICISPFIFPYHGYPAHYCNFSKDGLEHLYRGYRGCDITMNIGPTAALTNLLSEYFAVFLSGRSKFAYTLFKGLFLLPIFFFKYLDIAWRGRANAHRISSTLCTIATK